jgi:adenylate kinase family enzyme
VKLRVVGVSGAGKSRLARDAAARLGVAHLELDAVFWDARWSYRNLEQARALVRDFAAQHPQGWVVEGNWTSRLEGLLDPGTPGGADTWVWLDHARATVMRRVVLRTLRRGLTGEELWHGNRERLASWLRWDPEENIVRWAWTQYPQYRERMTARIAAGEPVIRLSGQRAVDRWLDGLVAPGAARRA